MRLTDQAQKRARRVNPRIFGPILKRYHNALFVLGIVEANTSSNDLRFEARRQFCVTLAAVYEVYWREQFRKHIKANAKKVNLSVLKKEKFGWRDLQKILGREVTVADLVVTAFPCRSTQDVHELTHNVFDLDLFGEFRRQNPQYTLTSRFQALEQDTGELVRDLNFKAPLVAENVMKARDLIDECFEIRHEAAHDTGARHRVSKRKALQIAVAMMAFNLTLGAFLQEKLKDSG